MATSYGSLVFANSYNNSIFKLKSQAQKVMCTHIWHFLVVLTNVYKYAKKHTRGAFKVGANGRER